MKILPRWPLGLSCFFYLSAALVMPTAVQAQITTNGFLGLAA